MIQNTGYGTFIFFGVFATLSGVWTWFCVPETKGKTLEQMDEVFNSNLGHEDMEAKGQITDIICSDALQVQRGRMSKGGELEMIESVGNLPFP